jgi:alpha-galactosidase
LITAIGMTGGMVLFSDNFPDLFEERIKLAGYLLPPIDQHPQVIDWFDAETPSRLRLDLENDTGKWNLLALFNWSDHPQEMEIRLKDFRLSAQEYWVRSFWEKNSRFVSKGCNLWAGEIPAHGVILLSIRMANLEKPQFIGSDLHISQGLEIINWKPKKRQLHFDMNLGRIAEGQIELYLPFLAKSMIQDGKQVEWKEIGLGRYLINIRANLKSCLDVFGR